MNKPGYLTTEFWVSAASQVLSLLVIVGVITLSDKTTLEGAVTSSVAALATLATNAVVIWKYIASRTTIKTAAPASPPAETPLMP